MRFVSVHFFLASPFFCLVKGDVRGIGQEARQTNKQEQEQVEEVLEMNFSNPI